MKRLMAAALTLVEQGFYVFPLRPGDKRPNIKHWEKRATPDPDRVYRWWVNAPYNIGVATGPSQLVVIDFDTAADNAAQDWSSMGDRVAILGRQLPRTLCVRTPSGGLHLYFTAFRGVRLGNTAGRLGKHIDTRGVGGYVVGPGSIYSGRVYSVVDPAPIAPLPGWIADRLTRSRQQQAPPTQDQPRTSRYLRAILEGEVERVRAATPGTRNNALNTAAFILGQLVGSGEITEEHAWSLLRSAARGHIGVDGFTEWELEQTATSGVAAGMRRPRSI